MAINIPYHSSVEPIVPDAQRNIAPELISRGVALLAQMGVAREKAQLESEQMATDAALKSRQLDIARENNLLDYNASLATNDRIAEYNRNQANAKAVSERNLFANVTRIQSEITDYQQEKEKRGLNDLNPKNIPIFLKNHIQLAYDFENADIPAIKDDIKNMSRRVKGMQAQIPLKFGAIKDEDGNWSGGETRIFTPAQVLGQIGDPNTRPIMEDALEASGMMKSTRPLGVAIGGSVSATGGAGEYQAPAWLISWANQSKGVDMTPTGTPRPSIGVMSQWMAKRTPANGSDLPTGVTQADVDEAGAAMAAEATPPDNNELLNPTDEEKEIARATRAAAMPGADKDKIKAIFQNKGYDPSKLSF